MLSGKASSLELFTEKPVMSWPVSFVSAIGSTPAISLPINLLASTGSAAEETGADETGAAEETSDEAVSLHAARLTAHNSAAAAPKNF